MLQVLDKLSEDEQFLPKRGQGVGLGLGYVAILRNEGKGRGTNGDKEGGGHSNGGSDRRGPEGTAEVKPFLCCSFEAPRA